MGYIKTGKKSSVGIALCAIAIAACMLLVAQVPQRAFAIGLAAASDGLMAGDGAKVAAKAQGSSGLSAQYFDGRKRAIPRNAVGLKLGEGVDVMAQASEVKWFTFTPSESGAYQFYTTGQQSGGEDYNYVFTYGTLYVVEDDMLSQVTDEQYGAGFSIRRELTKGKTYYLACSEYEHDEAAFTVFVDTYEYDEYDLNEYSWHLTEDRVFSKEASSLESLLDALRPYAVSPLDEELPFDGLCTAACYFSDEVYDEEAGEWVEREASFDSPLSPGYYDLRLTGKHPYHGTATLWFEVVSEDDLSQYYIDHEYEILIESATSEAALLEALNIAIYDFRNNPVGFEYGKDYSVEWYEGRYVGYGNETPLPSFPSEQGYYCARLIGNKSGKSATIGFRIFDPNDFANFRYMRFAKSAYYADGSAVSAAKLGGLGGLRYDRASHRYDYVSLEEGVDYGIEWVVYDGEDDDAGTVLASAPKDAGGYCARITAKGETYSGTCDVRFVILDPNDIDSYDFWGAEYIRYTGKPIEESQLALEAYRLDNDEVESKLKYRVVGWYKVSYDEGSYGSDDYASEPIGQSEVIDPGEYEVELEGVSPFKGKTRYRFEIAAMNSLHFAQVSGVAREYAYTGKPIALRPVVKMDGKTLAEGRDYTVELYYFDEGEYVTSAKEFGDYCLEISAIEGGDYVDWCSFVFCISESGYRVPGATPKSAPVGAKIVAGKADYKVTKSGSAPEVALTKSNAAGSFTVPASISSGGVTYKVTSIAPNAFKGNKKLKKVLVGDNIVSIGKAAFAKCPKLKAATLGTSVKTVGKSVFKGDKKLKKVTVRSGALTKASARNIVRGSKIKTVKLSGKAAKAKKKAYKKYFDKRVKVK